jgi:monovalent cation/proton antiporter MnhG/PhaG subunit
VIQTVAADVCLGLAVAIVFGSAAGVLAMPGAYRKLHFVTPAALVAPVLVVLAVFIRSGLAENTGESLVALVFIVISGPYLTHATARAAQVREQNEEHR